MTGTRTCTRCGAQLLTSTLPVCGRCLLQADLPSVIIGGRLEVQDEIGRGGMGAVFRARHLGLDRAVAVKFLPESFANQPEMKARFHREAQLLALLSHPHIVHVYDYGQEDGQAYITMEYVEGRPLSAAIPMSPKQAVAIAIQVCEALEYAHARGVIHRDIKPENILLDADGNAKVTDFGIARMTDPSTPGWLRTSASLTAGTPHYLAPEALTGAPPDACLDVYALGVVLYQCITGKLPIGDFDPLPGELDRLVRKALSPNPARRTPTASALRRDLTQLRLVGTDELPADERFWIHGAAMLSAATAAVSIWAGLLSLTPRVFATAELNPLTHFAMERLPDGRWVSRARFQTGPVVAAVVAMSVAFVALGVLRRHWRSTGLDIPRPDRQLSESKWVLALGLLCNVLYGVHRWLEPERSSFLTYVPLLGGVLELAILFVFLVGCYRHGELLGPCLTNPNCGSALSSLWFHPSWSSAGAWRTGVHEVYAPKITD